MKSTWECYSRTARPLLEDGKVTRANRIDTREKYCEFFVSTLAVVSRSPAIAHHSHQDGAILEEVTDDGKMRPTVVPLPAAVPHPRHPPPSRRRAAGPTSTMMANGSGSRPLTAQMSPRQHHPTTMDSEPLTTRMSPVHETLKWLHHLNLFLALVAIFFS